MILPFLITTLLATAPLEVIVFDSSLQRVVGYGKQSGNQLSIELLDSYSGPVVSMFLRDKVTSAQGVLVAGQLTLTTANGTSTLQQYVNNLGINLKLSVVKTPKLNASPDNSDKDGNGNGNGGGNGNGNGNGGGSGNGNGNGGGNGNGNGGGNGNGNSNGGGNGNGNGGGNGNGNGGGKGGGNGKNK